MTTNPPICQELCILGFLVSRAREMTKRVSRARAKLYPSANDQPGRKFPLGTFGTP